MRRFLVLLLCCILMVCTLAVPASAESMATKVESVVNVTADGDCIVSTTVRVSLDSPMANLSFPVPLNATDVTLNGGSARTTKTATGLDVDVSRLVGGMAGEIQLMLNYNIPGAVKVILDEDGRVDPDFKNFLQLELPLLSSFELPVQELTFVLTMPQDIRYKPVYSSI